MFSSDRGQNQIPLLLWSSNSSCSQREGLLVMRCAPGATALLSTADDLACGVSCNIIRLLLHNTVSSMPCSPHDMTFSLTAGGVLLGNEVPSPHTIMTQNLLMMIFITARNSVLLWNVELHCRIHRSSSLDSVLRPPNAGYIILHHISVKAERLYA
jgi:hypothetical protein